MPTATIAAYESALPDDPRIERKKMFGSPCAFVNRQMFFGTFETSIVARIGPARVATMAGQPGMRVFTPSEGKVWSDYLQLDPAADPQVLTDLASESLSWAAALPQNMKWSKRKGKRVKIPAAAHDPLDAPD